MKKIIINIAFIAIITGVFYSCTKEDSMTQEKVKTSEKAPQIRYYIDFIEVSKDNFDIKGEDNFISYSPLEKGDESIILANLFTTRKNYIKFGKENNFKVEELLNFEDDINKYIKDNEVIAEFEKTGIIPSSYIKFENEKYFEYFGESNHGKSDLTIYHKDLWHGPDRAINRTMPYLGLGWNNTISAFTPIGLYGFTTLYNRSFYRSKLATFWGWGMTRVTLNYGFSYYNDKTESVTSGGA